MLSGQLTMRFHSEHICKQFAHVDRWSWVRTRICEVNVNIKRPNKGKPEIFSVRWAITFASSSSGSVPWWCLRRAIKAVRSATLDKHHLQIPPRRLVICNMISLRVQEEVKNVTFVCRLHEGTQYPDGDKGDALDVVNSMPFERNSRLIYLGCFHVGGQRAEKREKKSFCGASLHKTILLPRVVISASSLRVSDWGWNEPTIHRRPPFLSVEFLLNISWCTEEFSKASGEPERERERERNSSGWCHVNKQKKINFLPFPPPRWGVRERNFRRCCCFSLLCSPLPDTKAQRARANFLSFLAHNFLSPSRYEKTVWWESSTGHDGIPLLWFVDSN